MKNKQWKYKVGGRIQGLIPSLFMLAIFGGIAIYLHIIRHGAFLFGLLLTIIMLVLIFLSILRGIFVKVLIYEDGFYHQTKPGNGRYYKYSEISQAWQSNGRELNGTTGSFCSYETYEGKTIKFPFLPFDEEGVSYLIERVKEYNINSVPVDIDDKLKEYIIDGKPYGKTTITATIVLLILFLVLTIPVMIQINYISPKGYEGLGFFIGTGTLIIGIIFILLVIRYHCFKVKIGSTGFYFRTTPFNGKYFSYSDIKSCRIEQKVYHHHIRGGTHRTFYYYYFIFTDKDVKTTKFQFQKPISEHEVEVLKKRIEETNKLNKNMDI